MRENLQIFLVLIISNMLPQAVLPPFDDHTYAQWLEREDRPSSPQPSPFKKVLETPVKKLFPLGKIFIQESRM